MEPFDFLKETFNQVSFLVNMLIYKPWFVIVAL